MTHAVHKTWDPNDQLSITPVPARRFGTLDIGENGGYGWTKIRDLRKSDGYKNAGGCFLLLEVVYETNVMRFPGVLCFR